MCGLGQQTYKQMNIIIVALLLTAAFTQDTVSNSVQVDANSAGDASLLPSSSPPQASVQKSIEGVQTFRTASIVKQPTNVNFLNQATLGGSSKWIFPSTPWFIRPLKWMTTYTISFTNDCPQNPITLTLASTGSFFVYLNGVIIKSWGFPYPSNIEKITLQKPHLKCGCNTIKVLVYNYYYPSFSAIIYSLSQDKTDCYTCRNAGNSYYNRDTCNCECAHPCKCQTNKIWRSYPTCGCRCAALGLCTSDFFWNDYTCSCQCKKLCCPKGQEQNSKTCKCEKICGLTANSCSSNEWFDQPNCKCVPKCLPLAACSPNQTWNFKTCQCDCNSIKTCNSIQKWNPQTCNCDCLALPFCTQGYSFDPSTCGCSRDSFQILPLNIQSSNNIIQSTVSVSP